MKKTRTEDGNQHPEETYMLFAVSTKEGS